MKKELKHKHAGHRQRLKNKVRMNGLKSLSIHEVLELLLTYTIPQKDTNALAHELIDRYNGFSNVLEADYLDIMNISGVGEETALFLTMLPDLFDLYKKDKQEVVDIRLNCPRDCVEYFRKHHELHSKEYLYVVGLNNMNKIVKTFEIEGVNDVNIKIGLKDFAQMITSKMLTGIILFHTHPNGRVNPSDDDIETTQKIFDICSIMGVVLLDHIILNEDNYYSFGCEGLIDEMQRKYSNLYSFNKRQNINLQQNKYDYTKI